MSEELEPDRISRLIADSVAGALSPEDARTLRRWADSSLQNRLLLEGLSELETMQTAVAKMRSYDTGKAWQRVETRSRRRRIMRIAGPLAGMAAAIAVVAGVYFSGPEPTNNPPVIALLPQQVEAPAVRLYRASGEVVVVDSTRRIDLDGAVVEADTRGMKVVAQNDHGMNSVVYNTVEVPSRKTFDVMLSDGTQVTLNAGSSLRFPETFAVNALREVYLSGEGYFTVSKDEKHPFIVHTGNSYVRVTGTQFNVSSYDDMPAAVTTLVEGRVLIGGAGANRETPLLPGMQAVQDRQTGTVTTSNVEVGEYTAWKTGVFAFTERPLKEILESMGRWYGCRVVYGEMARTDVRFSGKISQSCSLEEVAEFFRRTKELDITVGDGTLVVN